MEYIFAWSFQPFNFLSIPIFPHLMPTITERGDYLPRFQGRNYDHPGDHLLDFHKCMLEYDFFHEDVLINMFIFSLEKHACEWCRSLPIASILSLKYFHMDLIHITRRFTWLRSFLKNVVKISNLIFNRQ